MIFYVLGLMIMLIAWGFLGFFAVNQEYSYFLIIFVVLDLIGIILFSYGARKRREGTNDSRTTFRLEFQCERLEVEQYIKNFLAENQFKIVKYGMQTVYAKGNGFFTARKFISFSLEEDVALIEGWLGEGFKEKPLELPLDDGWYLRVPKRSLKNLIETMIENFNQNDKEEGLA